MTNQFTQSITAYRCRICKKYGSDDLLQYSESNKTPINLEKLLTEFFGYIKQCKIDTYTRRAIMLSKNADIEELSGGIKRIHIQPNAGRSFENFSVINHKLMALVLLRARIIRRFITIMFYFILGKILIHLCFIGMDRAAVKQRF